MKFFARHISLPLAMLFSALISAPVFAADLVMIEQPGCGWCEQWNRDISEIYPKTPEGRFAPLARMQLADTRRPGAVDFARPISYTPTFILVESGQELDRIEGYPGEDMFWGRLQMMLGERTDFDGEQGS